MSDDVAQCFNHFTREFLVSVTIHKARNLSVLNADTFVAVNFNDEKENTKTFQNSDCPFYNEYFAFEIKTTLEELTKKNIRLSVMQASSFLKKNAIIGEVSVNLGTIWKQNYHSFVKKWATLDHIGNDKKNTSAGYLQVDLAIVTTSEPPAPAILQTFDDDVIEENLLLPDASPSSIKRCKYLVNVCEGDFVVKRDYILQVSFGSTRTRTRTIKYTKHCKWNERLIFQGTFQSLSQTFVFEVLVQESFQWKVKCWTEVSFSDMCWTVDGTTNKPAFGPGFIYFYEGIHKNLYFGKLLVSIMTEEIDGKVVHVPQRKQDILMPTNDFDYWNDEIFRINMIVVNVDALNLPQKHMKIFLSCEGNFSSNIDLEVASYNDGKMKLKFVDFNSNVRPLMSLSVKIPDNRLKQQIKNLTQMLIHEMDSNIRNFKRFEAFHHDNDEYQKACLKMFLKDLKTMFEGMKGKLFFKTFKKLTKWDENFLKFMQFKIERCIEAIGKVLQDLCDVNHAFQEYVNIRDSLSEGMNDLNESTPDVFLNVTCEGKLLAFHRFKMIDYFHSQSFDAQGETCGKIHSLLIKPTTCLHSCKHCGCFFGKFDILMWIGAEKEINEWLPQNAVQISPNKVDFTLERYYKCNVFVHQAKIQPGYDKGGLADPKLVITVNGMHAKTKVNIVIAQSIAAVWNEVLVIENVKVFDVGYGSKGDYPSIMMFLFDEDKRKLDLIGIGSMKAPLKINDDPPTASKTILPTNFLPDKLDIRKVFYQFVNHFPPYLRWMNFYRDGDVTAEVLLSAEFVRLSAPTLTIKQVEVNEPIPPEIRPNMRKFRIEVTFVGIRCAMKMLKSSAGRYKVELSMGELKLSSGFSGKAYKTNLNFLNPHASGYLMLPDQIQFWPPIIIKHLDCSHKTPTVLGAAMIRRPNKFFAKEKPKKMQRFLLNQNASDDVEAQALEEEINENHPLLNCAKVSNNLLIRRALSCFKMPSFLRFRNASSHTFLSPLENEYTWWTKFYNSNREPEFKNDCLHALTIYPNELEKQPCFENFHDWALPVDLTRDENEKYATLKCSMKISKCYGKEYFESGQEEKFEANFPSISRNLMVEQQVVLRVYIVQALNLRSRDICSESDAYIKLVFGNQVVSDHAHYIPNQFSPVFGKRFQLTGIIPQHTRLYISVYDHDTLSSNDLIGSTSIDIEDRIRSKYLADCGLPKEFNSSGYNAWRNSMPPTEILKNLCNELELSQPQYFPDHVELAGIEFKDNSKITKDGNTREHLALSMLNQFSEIPGVGYSFVPEHVETRSLYRQDRPGVEQGKLLMWVEVFDPMKTVPEPIDIMPLPPRPYELRVVIWNAKDVLLDDKNIFGTQMSDIYVKGWMHDVDEAQFTDIHYRSLNGEANFNWRMVFPFKYSTGEDMMVIARRASAFDSTINEHKIPSVLNLQVWDNDSFSRDDFLGTLSLNLSHFPQLYSSHEKCQPKNQHRSHENLFAISRSVRGWTPVYGKSSESGAFKQTGKLEIELEVVLEDKAKSRPAGIGREGPNSLPPPNRPNTSFNWLRQPVKSVKHILWPRVKKFAVFIVVALVLVIVFGLIIMNFPQKIISKAIEGEGCCN